MSWQDDYAAIRLEGESWTDQLVDHDHVFIGSSAGEPVELIAQLGSFVASDTPHAPRLIAFQMFQGGSQGLLAAACERLKIVGLVAGGDIDGLRSAGLLTYLELSIGDLASVLASRALWFDAALVQVSPPDADGYVSLGPSVDFAPQALERARLAVAEVNDRQLPTHGANRVHISTFNALVETSRPLRERPRTASDDGAVAIGKYVAEIVPDRATLEIGTGSVMAGILDALSNHRGLSIHTGLITDAIMDLIRSGAVGTARGGSQQRIAVANQAQGTAELFEFLASRPDVRLEPASFTHDARVLSVLPRFYAVNSVFEVDLQGAVNAEYADGVQVAGVGGLVDFVRAGRDSIDGRSIIALRSTTNGGTVSRVVNRLSHPAGATIGAELADFVVTEHGVADLRRCDAAERAERMIRVAHPDFRASLREQQEAAAGT